MIRLVLMQGSHGKGAGKLQITTRKLSTDPRQLTHKGSSFLVPGPASKSLLVSRGLSPAMPLGFRRTIRRQTWPSDAGFSKIPLTCRSLAKSGVKWPLIASTAASQAAAHSLTSAWRFAKATHKSLSLRAVCMALAPCSNKQCRQLS